MKNIVWMLVAAAVVFYVGFVVLRAAWKIAHDEGMAKVRGDGVHLTMTVMGLVMIICSVAMALSPWVAM